MRVAIGPSSFGEVDRGPLDLLERHGVTIVPNPHRRRLTEDEITNHLGGVDGLIAGLEPLNELVLARADRLKAVARVGVGLDNVDLKAAEQLGIRVSTTPDAPSRAVAEAAVGNMITLLRRQPLAAASVREGRWEKQIGENLCDATVLIVGFGRIGRLVARFLEPFEPTIIVYDPLSPSEMGSVVVAATDLRAALADADVVSIHASGSEPILDRVAMNGLKKGAVILACGRGGQVDEAALHDAVTDGRVAAAWLDVFETEPYQGSLAKLPQVVMTPHMATYTRGTRRAMELEAAKNLVRDLELSG